MNRWHQPEFKTPSLPRSPAPPPTGVPAPLEMQIRALREALDRAARASEDALVEAKALRESLICERLRNADLQMRYKQLQQYHNATTVGETEGLQKENRRLRTVIGEASVERAKLIEEIRARTPFQPYDPTTFEQAASVAIEPAPACAPHAASAKTAARAR